MNGKRRQQLAEALQPWLGSAQSIGLEDAKAQLRELAPTEALTIDGKETAHILRRAGFTKDYDRKTGPSFYKRQLTC